ncbi:MAG: hypothetical protein JWN14_4752 [Chthonomonadales bacterium]|nr:hypothetical protein [Chthonomonadales bacterium]
MICLGLLSRTHLNTCVGVKDKLYLCRVLPAFGLIKMLLVLRRRASPGKRQAGHHTPAPLVFFRAE